MSRIRPFLGGLISGVLGSALLLLLAVWCLPHLLVVDNDPTPADAIVILGGNITRLQPGLRLYDQGLAPRLLLTGNKKANWLQAAQKACPDCRLTERPAVFLENSTDTHSDARLSLRYCRDNNLRSILVVTSPYHTRRTQLVFSDIFAGSGIEPLVISSNNYDKLFPPDAPWWRDRPTIEAVWLEFGKILYWELTPYMAFRGND
jgi:uncharacterized SAM-binding protein YcdF (DUF218 family)